MNYFRKVSECDSTIVFDIEDSIMEVGHPERSRSLKVKYRKILIGLLSEHVQIYRDHRIGIRINDVRSVEFQNDIRMLGQLRSVSWDVIIIPKVEYRADIELVLNELKKNNVSYRAIGIFAETEKGVENLQDIIHPAFPELEYVIFGHSDFNIDNNIFPFVHQDHPEYWNWVNKIQSQLAGTNITYINSPCFYLGDDKMMRSMLDQLYARSSINYGQMTLTYQQTLSCHHHQPVPCSSDQLSSKMPDAIEFAQYVIDKLHDKDKDKSFAVDQRKHLLTPHEIIVAKQIMAEHKGK